jgi:glycerol-3-phosphate cytidylyltransferase
MSKIGYTTGVFDMFHIGHLNLLKRAKSECDYLVVGVTTDELCRNAKGVEPVISQEDRFAIVGSIKYVDEVVYQKTYDKTLAHDIIAFDIMFVGNDWKGTDKWNELEVTFAKRNVAIRYFEYTGSISSSKLRELLNKLK